MFDESAGLSPTVVRELSASSPYAFLGALAKRDEYPAWFLVSPEAAGTSITTSQRDVSSPS